MTPVALFGEPVERRFVSRGVHFFVRLRQMPRRLPWCTPRNQAGGFPPPRPAVGFSPAWTICTPRMLCACPPCAFGTAARVVWRRRGLSSAHWRGRRLSASRYPPALGFFVWSRVAGSIIIYGRGATVVARYLRVQARSRLQPPDRVRSKHSHRWGRRYCGKSRRVLCRWVVWCSSGTSPFQVAKRSWPNPAFSTISTPIKFWRYRRRTRSALTRSSRCRQYLRAHRRQWMSG